MTQLAIMMRTSDWLRSLSTTGDAAGDPRVGALAVLSAGLELTTVLAAPSSALLEPLRSELAQLPPQLEQFPPEHPFVTWINIAALAELLATPPLAHLILIRLQQLMGEAAATSSSRMDAEAVREAVAFCWARRGRVTRVAGQLEDAARCYREAIRLTGRGPWRDARSHAEMGLVALAHSLGNLPAAERRARRILTRRPPVAPLYLVQAHQMLALTKRRRGALVEALLHGWEAYDLLDESDPRRMELMVTLSEIALEFGQLDAASQGFAAVVASSAPWRILVPALAGALSAASRRVGITAAPGAAAWQAFDASWDALEHAATHVALAPRDELLAALALARAGLGAMRVDHVDQWLERARIIADTHGFHEKRFAVSDLAAELAAARARTTPRDRPAIPAGAEAREVARDSLLPNPARSRSSDTASRAFRRFADVRLAPLIVR